MKIEHKRLYEQVIQELEKKYKHDEIKIGEKLPPERGLAETFGVSRGTLRDAFRVLESQGIIETKPGGGRILIKQFSDVFRSEQRLIKEIRKAAIVDLLEARKIMELGIVELVCERATDYELEELKNMFTVKSKKNKALFEDDSDFNFHYSLARLSRNDVLVNFINLNFDIITDARRINFSKQNYFEKANLEHYEILKAVQARDKEAAKQAVNYHLEQIQHRLENNNDE